MRAGTLRRRLTIEQRTGSNDAAGQPPETWATVATVWGAVEDTASAELIRSTAVTEHVNTVIRIRHRTGVTPDMRIVDAGTGRTFQIVGPPQDPDARRRQLLIPCKEITP